MGLFSRPFDYDLDPFSKMTGSTREEQWKLHVGQFIDRVDCRYCGPSASLPLFAIRYYCLLMEQRVDVLQRHLLRPIIERALSTIDEGFCANVQMGQFKSFVLHLRFPSSLMTFCFLLWLTLSATVPFELKGR